MKRDMDLVSDILIALADEPRGQIDTNSDVVNYHLEMLNEKNFVEGIITSKSHSGRNFTNLMNPRLTWAGHEFLDTIRQQNVWDKIKGVAKDKGVGLTIESITTIASSLLSALITAAKS